MKTKNNPNKTQPQNRTHKLISTEKELQVLFSENKYLEIISKVQQIEKLIEEDFLDLYFFNNKISCLIYLGLSFCQLGNYQEAKISFLKIQNRLAFLLYSIRHWKHLIKISVNERQSDIAQTGYKLLKEQLNYYNETNSCNFLSNLAYTYYKLKEYKLSVSYYKKALKVYYKKSKKYEKDKSREMQLHLGIAEAQYYYYRNITSYRLINKIFYKNLPQDIKDNYDKTIRKLKNMESSFDVLLALGKMYYFLGKYDESISFLQKAIELPSVNKDKNEIYAFDWLSRIAFKTKRYEIATDYYKKIIDALIKTPIKNEQTIHPRPELHKMFEFLNKNKEKTLKHDIHYINKSIWGGIIAGTILESAEILSSQGEVYPFFSPINIVVIMIILVLLTSIIYINIYK